MEQRNGKFIYGGSESLILVNGSSDKKFDCGIDQLFCKFSTSFFTNKSVSYKIMESINFTSDTTIYPNQIVRHFFVELTLLN